jgi:tRNA (pseudouridine54-N1)-methyltransferase
MRHFILVGQRARTAPDFLLADIPSTSGRLDVLLRGLRAALLVSHGVRRDVVVYLCLLGPPEAPRTLRFAGPAARYMRPDERSLASVVKKALATPCDASSEFEPVREGIAIAHGGVERALAELDGVPLYVLDEQAADIRACGAWPDEAAFVIGDHLGLPDPARAALAQRGAQSIRVGPVSLHAEDAIALVHNELDRAAARAP